MALERNGLFSHVESIMKHRSEIEVVAEFLNEFKKEKVDYLREQRDKYLKVWMTLCEDADVHSLIEDVTGGLNPINKDRIESILIALNAVFVFKLTLKEYNSNYSSILNDIVTACRDALKHEKSSLIILFQDLVAELKKGDSVIKETYLKQVADEVSNCLSQLQKYHTHDVKPG